MKEQNRSVGVIGGGPAGLRAAEVAALAGARVTLYDHKPSVGRKFLVAGKSGLNLTHASEMDVFASKYSGWQMPESRWRAYLENFDTHALREWARSLGVETFVASGGKVFPESKKAAPLLRRWVLHLKALGVEFVMNHRWVDLRAVESGVEVDFSCRGEGVCHRHDAVVLALGGASWPQTGSDGGWVSLLEGKGVAVEPLKAANCGWACKWTAQTRRVAEGQPLHHLEVRAGDAVASGELMVTRYGFEGAPIYQLGRTLRGMDAPVLDIDFKPVFTIAHMVKKMESARSDFLKEAQVRWKLSPAMCAIIEQIHGRFDSAEALARATKSCRIPLFGPRPIAEVISTAGGVAWRGLNASLMLKQLPRVYCAGEMIDWEAPTGGYLMQGCFATGTVAGRAAALSV